MFVNISPADYNMEETVTTLVYGSRAKLITNDTQKNVETRMQARMNEAYKQMQLQLDLAVQALKTNNIPIPSEIKIEEVPAMQLEEVKEEEVDITKFPEFRSNQPSVMGSAVGNASDKSLTRSPDQPQPSPGDGSLLKPQ